MLEEQKKKKSPTTTEEGPNHKEGGEKQDVMTADEDFENEDFDISLAGSGGSMGDDDDNAEDDNSTNLGTSVSSGKTNVSGEKLPTIAAKETKKLNRLKILVLIALLVPTAAIACGVYLYTSHAEEQEFENQYYDDAYKIQDSFGRNLDTLLEATESLVVATVSYAYSTNQSWPFVTLPDFASRVSIIRSLAKTAWISQYYVVTDEDRLEWEDYTSRHNSWVNESIKFQETEKTWQGPIVWDYNVWDVIHDYGEYEIPEEEQGLVGTNYSDVYFPNWQNFPVVPYYVPYNWDLGSIEDIEFIKSSMIDNKAVITYPYLGQVYVDPNDEDEVIEMGYEADWLRDYIDPSDEADEPVADLVYPIITNKDGSNVKDGNYTPSPDLTPVGMYSVTYYWRELLRDILPAGSSGIHVVFESSCRPSFTYKVNGAETVYLGPHDYHDPKYDDLVMSSNLLDLSSAFYTGIPIETEYCPYIINAYPSDEYRAAYTSSEPLYITLGAVAIFAILHTIVFLAYDRLVQRRNKLVVNKANRSRAVVASLFPAQFRDQLFGDDSENSGDTDRTNGESSRAFVFESPKKRLNTFLASGNNKDDPEGAGAKSSEKKLPKPIAEVFTDTTVMFADIVGFTAWSSVREPDQVFTLLETLYAAFDKVANKRKVFKVETVGDCYVAAAGVPEPREDHAIVMARFAAKCRAEMRHVTRRLEVSLGPETADLGMRFGLHSGSVTAGVLRGAKARFQLFGDTVNTAARMESTGITNQIHVSKKTADLIVAAGYQNWITARVDLVEAKGIGSIQTYIVNPNKNVGSVASSVYEDGMLIAHTDLQEGVDQKTQRLVNWMTEVFANLLKDIKSHRYKQASRRRHSHPEELSDWDNLNEGATCVRAEVKEIIELPEYDENCEELLGLDDEDKDAMELDKTVLSELRRYITDIALCYRNNHFHNFEHACQVTMVSKKLLSRIVAPNDVTIERRSDLHDNTYGITSDPLTAFAVMFSALIHDVDHPGVSNQQLVEEKARVAMVYDGKSVSEQHSVDLAWQLLLDPSYSTLRDAIFVNDVEFKRFRALIVNSVMATDIFDKDLKAIRDSRWEKAFDEEVKRQEGSTKIFSNRRATIVIEHIIQASDIAHCMQHWKVYQKWNKRLFTEMHVAYKAGRLAKNPADFWYGGELWFYDNYIIPLAKKLKFCGVFGVSCDEFLDCALDNRQEWERCGKEIVLKLVAEMEQEESTSTTVVQQQPQPQPQHVEMKMTTGTGKIVTISEDTTERDVTEKGDDDSYDA